MLTLAPFASAVREKRRGQGEQPAGVERPAGVVQPIEPATPQARSRSLLGRAPLPPGWPPGGGGPRPLGGFRPSCALRAYAHPRAESTTPGL
eukprot:scaffold6596_cov64-Phaeocystis_antarctica.AAC.2